VEGATHGDGKAGSVIERSAAIHDLLVRRWIATAFGIAKPGALYGLRNERKGVIGYGKINRVLHAFSGEP